MCLLIQRLEERQRLYVQTRETPCKTIKAIELIGPLALKSKQKNKLISSWNE